MAEMETTIRRKRFHRALGRRLADYPLREGKGIRPALCLATCQAFGGTLAEALPSAVALELFHNAFLVHDDIEDGSLNRRGSPTMHEKFGTAIAINVGDALNVLSMTPLLDNTRVIGLEKALRVFHEIELMARESVEGQAMELEWVRTSAWELTDRHYHQMTSKKTCWYTCITPCRIGALIAVGAHADLEMLRRFGYHLGVAFQIQDDVLNLVAGDERYGKEALGDIWEGKRTLMLIRLMRAAAPRERERVVRIMRKSRARKTQGDVAYVFELMQKYGCVGYAREASRSFARSAERIFDRYFGAVPDSQHKAFLREAVDYVVHREL
ncbi:MAG: polyprenyl synthetase family protein [Candidatus Eremiobacteraeota bacterium]|nr:polyprenyl synthetase family protein [Candidatus Eremiobacteraeota bacterium]